MGRKRNEAIDDALLRMIPLMMERAPRLIEYVVIEGDLHPKRKVGSAKQSVSIKELKKEFPQYRISVRSERKQRQWTGNIFIEAVFVGELGNV